MLEVTYIGSIDGSTPDPIMTDSVTIQSTTLTTGRPVRPAGQRPIPDEPEDGAVVLVHGADRAGIPWRFICRDVVFAL